MQWEEGGRDRTEGTESKAELEVPVKQVEIYSGILKSEAGENIWIKDKDVEVHQHVGANQNQDHVMSSREGVPHSTSCELRAETVISEERTQLVSSSLLC